MGRAWKNEGNSPLFFTLLPSLTLAQLTDSFSNTFKASTVGNSRAFKVCLNCAYCIHGWIDLGTSERGLFVEDYIERFEIRNFIIKKILPSSICLPVWSIKTWECRNKIHTSGTLYTRCQSFCFSKKKSKNKQSCSVIHASTTLIWWFLHFLAVLNWKNNWDYFQQATISKDDCRMAKSGLGKKIEFQLVLWASSPQILLALGSCMLVLVFLSYDSVVRWFAWAPCPLSK